MSLKNVPFSRIIFMLLIILASIDVQAQLLKGQPDGFTRRDTLRGMLTSYRTCYEVIHYDLNVKVEPDEQFISGHNRITYRTVAPFRVLQIDLFENMNIDRILHRNEELNFRREYDAVFVEFPSIQPEGMEDAITVYFSGNPVVAKNPPWDGGFVWERDKNNNHWIGVAVQGLGASAWWPNKDHLSDEPETMNISVAVPQGLFCKSNGQLLSVEPGSDGFVTFRWFVSYPINIYNVTVNIGDYAYFKDHYVSGNDTLFLHYYVLPYNLEKAREHFQQVIPMMEAFEHFFGPYPFWYDGFSMVETPYLGMEHQSAIAYGNQYKPGYLGITPAGLKFDYIIIHEAAHEWWGNNVSMGDLADMWIHEAFATYAEALYVEYLHGYDKAIEYVNASKRRIRNKEPIVGLYGVNREGSSDMYIKGALMLNTLRHVLQNDQLWFSILKGIQTDFRHSIVDTETITAYISNKAGRNLGYFFEQYLFHPDIPTLEYSVRQRRRGDVILRYRWVADVQDFRMPVKVYSGKEEWNVITPGSQWKEMTFKDIRSADIRIDTNSFYIKTERVR